MFETSSKGLPVTKEMVRSAYRKVRSNQGAAGVDRESLETFRQNELNNLYMLWNRLSSGSYFPKPVRSVMIPKGDGKMRELGIPTVSDRIAQQVIKDYLEPRLEATFADQSYGYRPLKNAHQAVIAVTENVRNYSWVLDLDIKSFFDEVDHELLMKAVDRHVPEDWVKMYIQRWLESPVLKQDGTQQEKNGRGTPQGGVISPLLANLFLHYVIDKWLVKEYPAIAFVRYADDIIIHCHTEEQAKTIMEALRGRLAECRLRLNEEKTKVVYCQNYQRKKRKDYGKKFDFLGFTFKPRSVESKYKGRFLGYDCSISQKSESRIMKSWQEKNWLGLKLSLQEIANKVNVQMKGIITYYGKFNRWKLSKLYLHFGFRLAKWALKKYKRFSGSYKKAFKWVEDLRKSYPNLFYHWKFC